MKLTKPEIAVIVTILVLLALLIGGISAKERTRYSIEAYHAWCKLSNRHDFTYEEWTHLRRAGLIGDSTKSEVVVAPIVIPK